MFGVKTVFVDEWCFSSINPLHGIFTDDVVIDELFEIFIGWDYDYLHIRILFVFSCVGSDDIISFKSWYLEWWNMELGDDFLSIGNLSFEIRISFGSIGFVINIHIVTQCLSRSISCDNQVIWLVHKQFYHHTHKSIGNVDVKSIAIGHIRKSVICPEQKTWAVEYVEFFHIYWVNNNCFGYTFLYSYYNMI